MHKRFFLALAAAAASAVALLPAGAGAAANPSATVLYVRAIDGGNAAIVRARYTCVDKTTHLWVSAKQGEAGRRDPRLELPGSSQYAKAWLQRHPAFDLKCDGAEHVGRFRVDKSEYGFGTLVSGKAWIQFCMTWGPESDPHIVMATRWVNV